ncbi:MAG: N-acetyl-gamma-glutamyl-phosphate reductase [Spirochaetia bacterium]|nr:N-acetyl-gamma-glutamyl-phosphate reductase [Spirochaetia bacterium]
MKRATIVGATGFGGLGLIEILLRHPEFSIKQLIARKDVNIPVSNVFPHLKGLCDMRVDPAEKAGFDTDIAFFSTPDRAGMEIIDEYYKRNIPVIDFSGDFRFKTTQEYAAYATNKGIAENHLAPHVLSESVYGLPEKNRALLRTAKVAGNPGCFAITMILGLLPAMDEGIIESDIIICDGKTGVSGAGKNSGEANLYPQRYENISAYREGQHQHLVETENIINAKNNTDKKILFVPQIVPMTRGILVTIYADIKAGFDTKKIMGLYNDYYKGEPFVFITERSPGTADVRGSNRCLIKPIVDPRTGKLIVTAVTDNLVKGQSGNAVQTANIMMGFDETQALNTMALYP